MSRDSEPEAPSLVPVSFARARALRALVVEDDPLVARSLTRWLRLRDVVVAVAVRPADLETLGTEFDVGIFDIDLPESNGVALAQHCLKRGIVRRAVFFSGSRDPELRAMASALGDFVEKGTGMDALAERVLQAYRPSSVPSKVLAVG